MRYYRYQRPMDRTTGGLLRDVADRALRRQVAVESALLVLFTLALIFGVAARLDGVPSGLAPTLHGPVLVPPATLLSLLTGGG